MSARVSRRQLIRAGIVAGGSGIALGYKGGIPGIVRDAKKTNIASATSDFVILGANDTLPSSVQPPSILWPRICSAGDVPNGAPAPAEYEILQDPDELATVAGCSAYRLSTIPSGIDLHEVSVTRTSSQTVMGGDVQYTHTDQQTGQTIGTLHIQLAKYFPSPFPLWEDDISDGDMGSIQAVTYLPSAGYIHMWDSSYQLYWIEDDVLYILFAEKAFHPYPDAVAALLVT